MKKSFIAVIALVAVLLGGYFLYTNINHDRSDGATTQPIKASTTEPTFDVTPVAKELNQPWDVTFLPDGTPLVTQNSGVILEVKDGGAQKIGVINDVNSQGEGGLMGAAIDPDFAENRTVYFCYNTASDVRVVSWTLQESPRLLIKDQNIVTGIPSNESGRHSGCRLVFGPDGYLWIGTGDAAQASNPQDPKSLGGKILRIKKDGSPASGNLGGAFDPRIYSYGHRNIQGLAFSKQPINSVVGFSVEHGSSIDDEVNPLVKGNFGWNPKSPYIESGVPMTDREKYPNAVEAMWSSGSSTQAPSGAGFINGEQWQSWDGALAIAVQKNMHLKIFTFNDDGSIKQEFRVLDNYGRIRDVEQAPDGSLYVTTDNKDDNDVVLKLTPR